ncbi:MAG: hypothetical protein E3K32_00050 [wastewater metagenome]|nr:hypothetical protein [Candidatus Loosdrechtia aerotolerans]
MMLKTGIFAGAVALVLTAMVSVSHAEVTQKELCKNMWDSFQGMRKMTGLMEATDEQFSMFSDYSKKIADDTKKSTEGVAKDKNYKVLNEEVLYHVDQIDKAATNKDLEEIQVQFRRLTIACRNCHKIYKSEMKLVP